MEKYPIYWKDPLKSRFEVRVDSCAKANEHFEINIAEDVIRPAGGGQAGDRGIITVKDREVTILDTILRDDAVILLCDRPVKAPSSAELLVDIRWRKAMMKNHTAEHLLMGALSRRHTSLIPDKIWIDGEQGSVEVGGVELSVDDLIEAENEVQHVITLDVAVQSELVDASVIDADVRAREGLVDKHENVRVIRIGEYDASACSGIHVSRTGEIGFFKIQDFSSHGPRTHIRFVTGERGASLVSQIFNEALRRKHAYPFEMSQLGPILDRSKKLSSMQGMILDTIERLIVDGPSLEEVNGVAFRHEFIPGVEMNNLKRMIKKLKQKEKSILLLFAAGEKCVFLIKTKGISEKVWNCLQNLVERLGGRGGGSGEVYTGGFVNVDTSIALYENFISGIRECLVSQIEK